MVPLDNGNEGDVQKMKDDQTWRYVIGAPIVLEVISLIVLTFFIKHESIIQLLSEEEPDSPVLLAELKKVYTIKNNIMTYEELGRKLKREIQPKAVIPISI